MKTLRYAAWTLLAFVILGLVLVSCAEKPPKYTWYQLEFGPRDRSP